MSIYGITKAKINTVKMILSNSDVPQDKSSQNAKGIKYSYYIKFLQGKEVKRVAATEKMVHENLYKALKSTKEKCKNGNVLAALPFRLYAKFITFGNYTTKFILVVTIT